MLDAIEHITDDNFLFQEDSAPASFILLGSIDSSFIRDMNCNFTMLLGDSLQTCQPVTGIHSIIAVLDLVLVDIHSTQ